MNATQPAAGATERPFFPLIDLTETELAAIAEAEQVLARVANLLNENRAAKLNIHLSAGTHTYLRDLPVIRYTVTVGASIGPHCYGHTLPGALWDLSQRRQPTQP